MSARVSLIPVLSLLVAPLFAGCSPERAPTVSFAADVAPIIEANCLSCHTPPEGVGYVASGLDMSSYETLMAGTLNDGVRAAVIKPGDSLSSTLNILVEGRADPSIRMPHQSASLDVDAITKLKAWVDQGALNN